MLKRFRSYWLGIPLLALALDQCVRAWCDSHLVMIRRYPIFGQKFLALTRFYNTGLAMDGLTSMAYDERKPAVFAISVAALLGVGVVVLLRRRSGSRGELLGLSLVLAAGVSNLIDAWRLHAVVDTFQIQLAARSHVPFNLADLMIWTGVALASVALAREISTQPGVSAATRLATHEHCISAVNEIGSHHRSIDWNR